MQHQATPNARRHAPELRNGMTDSERRLWAGLRAEQLGVKFRRQHPLGPYVLDFACLDPKLAIEIDGSQHLDRAAYDTERDAWLIAQGYVVLRFWANEALSNTVGVLCRIQEALAQRRAPTPALPQRGGSRFKGADHEQASSRRLHRCRHPHADRAIRAGLFQEHAA